MSQSRKFKRCFITGITGSAGSFLAEYILKKDPKIKIFGTYRNKNKLKYINKIKSNRLKLTNLNLLHYKKLKKFLIRSKPDLIYHFASDADVRKSFDLPHQVILNNNNITLNLLEAIREINFKPLIIICSTPEVYGNVENNNKPILETEKNEPQSPYAVSKCFQDLLSQVYFKSYKIKIIIKNVFLY